jgi:hypothetical protein
VIYRIEVANDGPRIARGIVAAELSERVRTQTLERLKLLVSELVTHRIRTGRAGEMITLELRAADTVRCGVIDDGPVTLPRGLGMTLVDRLATRWGVSRDRERHCTQIWAETSPTP